MPLQATLYCAVFRFVWLLSAIKTHQTLSPCFFCCFQAEQSIGYFSEKSKISLIEFESLKMLTNGQSERSDIVFHTKFQRILLAESPTGS